MRSLFPRAVMTCLFVGILSFAAVELIVSPTNTATAKDKGSACDTACIHKTAGYPAVNDGVLYILPTGPNAGLPRPAVVIRSYGDPNSGSRENLYVVDLVVFTVAGDLFPNETVESVPKSEVFQRDPGTWDWVRRPESGF